MPFLSAQEFFRQGSGVVTLCGSTKFFNEAMEANRLLTFENWIVLSCGSWGHSFHKYATPVDRSFEDVKKLHYQKILMSQAVVVVSDESCYIGSSTKAEIAFANWRSIPVFYYNGKEFSGFTNNKLSRELEDTSLIDRFLEINGTLGF